MQQNWNRRRILQFSSVCHSDTFTCTPRIFTLTPVPINYNFKAKYLHTNIFKNSNSNSLKYQEFYWQHFRWCLTYEKISTPGHKMKVKGHKQITLQISATPACQARQNNLTPRRKHTAVLFPAVLFIYWKSKEQAIQRRMAGRREPSKFPLPELILHGSLTCILTYIHLNE